MRDSSVRRLRSISARPDTAGMLSLPTTSVVIATRDRPELVRGVVEAVLEDSAPSEVIVVDQGPHAATARALAPVMERDRRVRHVRTATRGLSIARNIGVDEAIGEVVCFTDDDCRPTPGWVAGMAASFARDESIGGVFGAVVAPDGHDASAGFVPTFRPIASVTLPPLRHPDFTRLRGAPMGANMAFRRSALCAIGGFDACLGAGTPFGSAEDVDALYRVLRLGYRVAIRADVRVAHVFGDRPYATGEARVAVLGAQVGLGAYHAKHVRCGDAQAAWSALRWLATGSREPIRRLVAGSRPRGAGQLAWFGLGVARSWHSGVDRRQRLYVR